MSGTRLSILIVLAVIAAGGAASADQARDEAIALALFHEGRALAASGDHAHACPKFEAADRLTEWLGVELNLADCYAHVGRTASAWVLFRKAAERADALHDDRASYARERAAALEPTLARLSITAAGPASIEVRIDDIALAAAELGIARPIDPGSHLVEARVPGASSAWSKQIVIAPGQSLALAVPAFDQPTPPAPAARHRRPWLAWSLGGAGALMLGTSLGLGVSAKLHYDDGVATHCDAQLACDPLGLAAISEARRRGVAATIVGGLGLATVATGLVIYWTRRDDRADRETISVVPIASPALVGLALGGTL